MRKKDFEDLLWFLAHEGVCIFVDDGAWYVSVEASCGFLATNGLCRIYEERPTICRTYSAEGCDRDEDTEYELHFQSFEELFTYLQARFPGFRGAGLEVLKQPLRMPGGAADQPVWLRGRRASSRV